MSLVTDLMFVETDLVCCCILWIWWCNWVKQEVKYLGYVVSNTGVCAYLDKVRAVKDFPRPQNLKQLHSFLGLASYYRRFIPKFSQAAAPLYALTKKDAPYQWNSSCKDTFEQKLVQAPCSTGFSRFL